MKSVFKNVILIFFLSFFINFFWEISQMVFFTHYEYLFKEVYPHVIIPTIWDAIIIIIIYLLVSTINKNTWWINSNLSKKNIILSMMFWIIIAVSIEINAVYIVDKWWYSTYMPLIFWIWVVPIIQMIILPPLIFLIINKLIK